MVSLPHAPGVYAIRCLVSGRVYIGSSQDIALRFKDHRTLLRTGKHHCIGLQRAWNKYGEIAFVVDVLELADQSILLEREQAWFDVYAVQTSKRTYNASIVPGAPMKGRKHSQETRHRFSVTRRGALNPNYKGETKHCAWCGVKFQSYDKQQKYCSFACYTKAPKSAETLQRYSDTSKGRKRTPESIVKYQQKRRQWYRATDPDGVEYVVHGLADFCREHGLDQGSMSAVVSGRRSNHKGWLCKKLDGEPR